MKSTTCLVTALGLMASAYFGSCAHQVRQHDHNAANARSAAVAVPRSAEWAVRNVPKAESGRISATGWLPPRGFRGPMTAAADTGRWKLCWPAVSGHSSQYGWRQLQLSVKLMMTLQKQSY
jgi:hypothetical protein